MVSATVSNGQGAPGNDTPRATFHVAPPPPPRPRTWKSELAIAFTLALLFNILVIASFLLLAPEPPARAEPPSITVELVQEPKPEVQPEQEPQPEPEQKEESRRDWGTSGDESGRPSAYVETDDDTDDIRQTDQKEESASSDEVTTARKDDGSVEEVPGWARTVVPGFDARVGKPDARSEEKQSARAAAGGDAYSNTVRDIIRNNVRAPLGARGVAQFYVAVRSDGTITHAVPASLSGNDRLDKAIWDGIRRSSPLPAPPPERMTSAVLIMPLTLKIGN
ncbi:MAG: TonB C-terminal domain-containing protein [Parvibaculum sp.]|uniref:TonB C-terminal domain-containing protein n=1 Tax=Parvibaculum sp. TaxID=2024848 RepID=UPI00326684CB